MLTKSKTQVKPAARFALRDRVRIVQDGSSRDEYAGQTGTVSGVNHWATGWVYETRLDTPVYGRAFCVMTERELVALTAEDGAK